MVLANRRITIRVVLGVVGIYCVAFISGYVAKTSKPRPNHPNDSVQMSKGWKKAHIKSFFVIFWQKKRKNTVVNTFTRLGALWFFLYSKLKRQIKGKHFITVDEIKSESKYALMATPKTTLQNLGIKISPHTDWDQELSMLHISSKFSYDCGFPNI